MRQLRPDEGDRVVRPQAGPRDLDGIARQSARDIDGQHQGARPVHVFDDRREEPLHGPRQPGAEDPVHDQIARVENGAGGLPFAPPGHFARWHAEPLQGLEVDEGAAAHVAATAEQQGGERNPLAVEVPRQDEGVSSIVSTPAQKQDAPRPEIPLHALQDLEEPQTGILHQDDFGHTEPRDGAPVDMAHLLRGQYFHCGRPPGSGPLYTGHRSESSDALRF